jgi:hypothetical protein
MKGNMYYKPTKEEFESMQKGDTCYFLHFYEEDFFDFQEYKFEDFTHSVDEIDRKELYFKKLDIKDFESLGFGLVGLEYPDPAHFWFVNYERYEIYLDSHSISVKRDHLKLSKDKKIIWEGNVRSKIGLKRVLKYHNIAFKEEVEEKIKYLKQVGYDYDIEDLKITSYNS